MRAIHLFLVLLATSTDAFTVGQAVNTTSGSFTGSLAPGSDGVSLYNGIPFAQPPIGNLRFAPPVRAIYSAAIREANTAVSCPANCFFGQGGVSVLPYASRINWAPRGQQLFDNIINADTSRNNEDCLLLSIWTKPQTGDPGKAVMVWFFGGSFAYGSYTDLRYNGRYLVEKHDVVLVVINYRSNIFGFPGAPNTRQNLGFLDQRMALEWIRDNIAGFGGDPNRITLFGESSGAASIDYYSLAWTQDPIIKGIIAQSGSAYGLSPSPKGSKVGSWRSVAWKLGCLSIFGDDAVLQCMRSKSYQEILQATNAPAGYLGLLASLTFGPLVDDVVIPNNWPDRFRRGQFIKVPRLTGTNNDEAEVVSPGFTALESIPLPLPAVVALSAKIFQCPCANQASDIVKTGVKLYRYRWFGYFPNTAFALGDQATNAYHSSEVAVVWGSAADLGIPNTPEETAIMEYVMNAWTAFAKDPENGLDSFGWPRYTPSNQQVVLLAYQNQSGYSLAPASKYDVGCFLLAPPPNLLNILTQFFGPRWRST